MNGVVTAVLGVWPSEGHGLDAFTWVILERSASSHRRDTEAVYLTSSRAGERTWEEEGISQHGMPGPSLAFNLNPKIV